jgi:CRP-like cAMP-binding protein
LPPVPPAAEPENRLLAALPAAEYARLVGEMTAVPFAPGDVVYYAGGPLRHVYFPRSGAFSLLAVLPDGAVAAVGSVGSEGLLGLAAFHGAARCRTMTVCHLCPCTAWRMPGDRFQRESGRPGPLRELLHRYARALFDQVTQSAACHALHTVPQRCATWLLQCRDRTGGDFPLTHESLARMLGVRRASVTESARALQALGLIRYRRGRVEVLDAGGLAAAACPCYRLGRDDLDRLA